MPSPDVFDALGDPTRRRLLGMLSRGGPATATRLADDLAISRQAVAKHLEVMRSAGITATTKVGREVRHEVVPARLDHAAAWLDARAREWDGRVRRIDKELARRRGDRD